MDDGWAPQLARQTLRRHLRSIREEHASVIASIEQAKRRRCALEEALTAERTHALALTRCIATARSDLARKSRLLHDVLASSRPLCAPSQEMQVLVKDILVRAGTVLKHATERIAAACRIDSSDMDTLTLAIHARIKSMQLPSSDIDLVERLLWRKVLHTLLSNDMSRQIYITKVSDDANRVLGQYIGVLMALQHISRAENDALETLAASLKTSLPSSASVQHFASEMLRNLSVNFVCDSDNQDKVDGCLCAAANAALDGDAAALIPSKELVLAKMKNLQSKIAQLRACTESRHADAMQVTKNIAAQVPRVRSCLISSPASSLSSSSIVNVDEESQSLGQCVSRLTMRAQEAAKSATLDALARPTEREQRYARQRAREIIEQQKQPLT